MSAHAVGALARGGQPNSDSRPRFARGSEVRRNLRASLVDGTAFSIQVGLGELCMAAFLLEVTKNQVASGLITTLPLLLGALLQLVSPAMVRRFGSNRRWVVLCAGLQSLTMLPIAAAAFAGGMPTPVLFFLVTLYWTTGLATGAAWTSWIGTIVPEQIRAHYFGYRNRWCQGGTLFGLLLGGAILRTAQSAQAAIHTKSTTGLWPTDSWLVSTLSHLPDSWIERAHTLDLPLVAFGIIFLLTAICRSISTYFLWVETEKLPLRDLPEPVSISSVMRTFGRSSAGRLLTYQCAFQVAAQVAQPFLNPFLLAQLKLPYDRYMMLIAAAYIGRMAALPSLGRLAKRIGERRLIVIAGIATVPLPLGWMVSGDSAWSVGILLVTQLCFGVAMAAWELSTFLLLFESIDDRDRTQAISTFYVGNWFSGTTGSMIGGTLIPLFIARFGCIHAYWGIFALSVALRLLVLPLVFRAARGEPPRRIEPESEPLLQQARS